MIREMESVNQTSRQFQTQFAVQIKRPPVRRIPRDCSTRTKTYSHQEQAPPNEDRELEIKK